ncbi:hypothetical protein ONE63_002356 [Megalurothrips usitatus]|uniref:Myogenesis-regulating glycosidase n=1 Tax=Megalurothrips usitatus TaxID=439358 RepID=A0AAV7XC63_9NEOP|nr:hypothetical protein ONE63_002356 [Megalurothrips usitatus]
MLLSRLRPGSAAPAAAPPAGPAAAGPLLGPPLGPLRPTSQISWADGVGGASSDSEEAASVPLLGAQAGRPAVVLTSSSPEPTPSTSSWVAVDVPGAGAAAAAAYVAGGAQPRRRLHRRNSISMPSLPTGPELDEDPRRGHNDRDGYNTSDTYSDAASEDEEELQRRDGGGGGARGSSATANGSGNGGLPAVSGAGGGGRSSRSRKAAMAKASDDELGLESDHLQDLSSPANSITSINSISSLLKEKLAMSLPAMLKRHRKPKDYKLRSFVAMLFLCIVFLVGFAHVYYNQQVLQKAYFDRIRLNHLERVVRVYNAEGAELLRGELGRFLRDTDKVYSCLGRHEHKDSFCMEWMGRARLYLQYEQQSSKVRCYQITWVALAEDVFPTDCYDLTGLPGAVKSHWYGGGHTTGARWPLEAGSVSWAPFLTGDSVRRDHQWGNVLRRFFISSKGVAITVDPRTPLHVSANQNNDAELCFQARYDDFAFVRPSPSTPAVLNYTMCTVSTGNMKELHQHLSEKSLWDGLKESDVETVNTLLTEPVWQIAPAEADLLTEQAILNYTEDVISLGFFRQGHILVNEFWQANVGDMSMDESRFPTMVDTIKIVHRRGFRIAFTLQPFIGTESVNFREAVRRKLLVGTRMRSAPGPEYVPALSRYRSLLSAATLDVTNKRTVPWFKDMLDDLQQQYKMDCFFLDLGVAYDLPYYYKFQTPLTNPDHFMTAFTELVQSSASVLGVSSAIKRPRVPTFVTLPAVPSTWRGLQSVIPTILTYGIIGYPFIMPGAVGGDYDEEPVNGNSTTAVPFASGAAGRNATTTATTPAAAAMAAGASMEEAVEGDGSAETLGSGLRLESGAGLGAGLGQGPGVGAGAGLGTGPSLGEEELQEVVRLADTELYVRWMQLANFLPVLRYTTLPNKYGSELILESARTLTSLRQKTVNPLLKKYGREALDAGLPIVRPLWMLDPQDPQCRDLADEFSIGEELIVAPVLQPGSTEREVYLPTGVWKDGIDGSLRKGNRWIHMYKVPLDKVAYFVKMPDNTRF